MSAYRATSSQCRPQRSPYRGEASRRSTTRAKASGDGVGHERLDLLGRRRQALRSNVARRISVRRSAGGDGVEPLRLQPGQDEGVDRRGDPGRLLDRRRGRHADRPERPVRRPRLVTGLADGLGRPAGQGAPIFTQLASASTAASGSFSFGGILMSSCVWRTAWIKRLSRVAGDQRGPGRPP